MKVKSDNRIHLIKKTAWLQDTLYEALAEINGIFSLELVFVFLTILTSLVITMYYFIQVFKKGVYDEETMKPLMCSLLYVVWQTTPVGLAIYYASKTIEKGKEMTFIIGKIVNICDEDAILNRVRFEFFNCINTKHLFHVHS